MDDNERTRRIQQKHREEVERNKVELWWVSFSDPSRPRGFLGVVIVEALGFTDALARANIMGINPGGEAVGGPVEPLTIPTHLRDRLLGQRDLVDIGVSTLEDET